MSTHNGPPPVTPGYDWLHNGPTIDESIPSLGKSLVGPPIVAPRPAMRGLAAWIPASEPSFAQEMPMMSSMLTEPYAGIDRSVDPNPMLQMVDRKPRFPYVPCSLPEQLPAADALALLAVSRDADEEQPDEHAPGSRGHLLRRAVGCDFRVRYGSDTRKPTRAKDRQGRDRRVCWNEQRRIWRVVNVRLGGFGNVTVHANPFVPDGRMYRMSSQPQHIYMHPNTIAQLYARIRAPDGSR